MKKIELSKQGWKNRGKYFALVDNDIFPIVNNFGWSYSNGYAHRRDSSTGKPKTIRLHREIWELKVGKIPTGLDVEHINQDKLDCRLENLRLATRSENACNIAVRKNNSSGFTGICKEVQKSKHRPGWSQEKWYASITKDRGKKTEKRYQKRFDYTDEGLKEAVDWYKQMSLELHGEYSIYNRPDENK